ncbi:MAG: metallophosphoesterase [Planctomycetota bacterium]|nr:metallophosphoesterase [Planctomycetota bacterium]
MRLAALFSSLLVLGLLVQDDERFVTTRPGDFSLPLPDEEDAFLFAVFGDRTGGPAEGIAVLEQAVAEINLLEPDLVLTVGDLIQGYNETPKWVEEMREYKGVMNRLSMPWFPVAGNHDVYWRGPAGVQPPSGEHDGDYEEHFGPLWYAFEHKGSWFVVLYSDEGDPRTGKKTFSEPAAQRMSPEQFAFLEETLERARNAEHVFLFLHHPRWFKDRYGDDWDRVQRLLVEAGNVRAVFAGHIHRMHYEESGGIEYFTLATVGGAQAGDLPAAGYLHHYELITVRKDRIAVASFPVGSASDPRKVTGEVGSQTRHLARELRPRLAPALVLKDDLSAEGVVEIRVENPVARPIEVTLVPESADARWVITPDHQHAVVQPGEAASFRLDIARTAGPMDAAFDLPAVRMACDWLGEDLRVPIPDRVVPVPIDPRSLPEPPRPEGERVLALDGANDWLEVSSDSLDVPDGPLTVEGWLQADEFRGRQGFLCKTEGSEYGLFLNDGVPSVSLHLNGRYVEAKAEEPVLRVGVWHHVAGVFDGERASVYVDGRRVASAPASGRRTLNGLPLVVGGDVDGSGNGTSLFRGRIDEVRVSRVARYTGEGFTPERRHEPDADTALLLHMDRTLGPWMYDSTATAHPLRRGDVNLAGE